MGHARLVPGFILTGVCVQENEQKGYDAWIAHYVEHNKAPMPYDCPAKRMRPESAERRQFINGWLTARDENIE